MLCKNNKLKIAAQTLIDKFELPDGLYSISDIQDYFEYIARKHKTELIILQHVNKIENGITFKIKTGYYLELLRGHSVIKSA